MESGKQIGIMWKVVSAFDKGSSLDETILKWGRKLVFVKK